MLGNRASGDWVFLKIRFGTSVDGIFQGMAIIGVCKRGVVQWSPFIDRLGIGEGVTPGYTNQLWILDYHCYETLHFDTRFDLGLLIKCSRFCLEDCS
jgi:hypothetical protein